MLARVCSFLHLLCVCACICECACYYIDIVTVFSIFSMSGEAVGTVRASIVISWSHLTSLVAPKLHAVSNLSRSLSLSLSLSHSLTPLAHFCNYSLSLSLSLPLYLSLSYGNTLLSLSFMGLKHHVQILI